MDTRPDASVVKVRFVPAIVTVAFVIGPPYKAVTVATNRLDDPPLAVNTRKNPARPANDELATEITPRESGISFVISDHDFKSGDANTCTDAVVLSLNDSRTTPGLSIS